MRIIQLFVHFEPDEYASLMEKHGSEVEIKTALNKVFKKFIQDEREIIIKEKKSEQMFNDLKEGMFI